MQLVVDVGNTETVVGLLGEDTPGESPVLRATWRYATSTPRTADELLLLLRAFLRDAIDEAPVRAVVGSVVPAETDRLRVALARLVEGPVFIVTPDVGLPIRLDVEEPRRWAPTGS
jgi:pantothenate kinase type III